MPLVRIDLLEDKSSGYREMIGEVVYEAMLGTLNVPRNDRFQLITEHPAGDFVVDPTYLGVQRTKDCVFIQITLNGLFLSRRLLDGLQAAQLGLSQHVFIEPCLSSCQAVPKTVRCSRGVIG